MQLAPRAALKVRCPFSIETRIEQQLALVHTLMRRCFAPRAID
jgi:hypothetical protein